MFFYQCHREQASSFDSPSGRPGGKSPSIIFLNILSQCCGSGMFIPIRIFSIPDPGSRIPDLTNKKSMEKNNKLSCLFL